MRDLQKFETIGNRFEWGASRVRDFLGGARVPDVWNCMTYPLQRRVAGARERVVDLGEPFALEASNVRARKTHAERAHDAVGA